MTLHILGAGSIGLLYASTMRLATRRKLPVCLLLQPHHGRKLRSFKGMGEVDQRGNACSPGNKLFDGVQSYKDFVSVEMKDFAGNTHLQNIPSEIIYQNGLKDEKQDIRNILLITKAPQAVSALESIFPRLHPTEIINLVVMTNGSLSVVHEIQQTLRCKRMTNKVNIIYASTTHGAIREMDARMLVDEDDVSRRGQNEEFDAFRVTWTGVGQTFIQGTTNEMFSTNLQHTLNETWNEVGMNSSLASSEEMYILNWKKLAANCAINPLTALRRCRNGDLISGKMNKPCYDDTFDYSDLNSTNSMLFYQLIREVSDLAKVEADKCSQIMTDVSYVKNELSYDNLSSFVENVVHQTARNKSSMLQDIIARRYPTEIMHLNGYVSKLGIESHGLEFKANSYISTEVERLSRLPLKKI